MSMLMIEDKIAKAIDTFVFDEEFTTDLNEDYSGSADNLCYRIQQIYPDAEFFCGATKACFVIPGCSEVIKVPFVGTLEMIYDEDGESTDDYMTAHYENANDLDADAECWDYCENELIKYENAVEAGFGEFFAETHFYGEKDNMPIYTQERVMEFYSRNNHSYSENSKNAYESLHHSHCVDRVWLYMAIDWYGVERVQDFLNYLDENDLNSDLHCMNIGFRMNGAPVLLDWAGYREEW